MPRPPSSHQTPNSNNARSSSSSSADRKPFLVVCNIPAGFKNKRLKKLFGADDVEIDREYRSANLYFNNIEDGIRGLRFNSMNLYDSQMIIYWIGPEFMRTIFVQGFSSSLKHSSFLKNNKIHNIFDLKQNQIHNMLARHFRSCSAITRIAIPTLPNSGEVKGTAFVEFEKRSSILNALLLDGSYVDGFKLHIELAHPKPGRPRKSSIFSRSTGTKIKFSDSDEDQMPGNSDEEDQMPRKIKFGDD